MMMKSLITLPLMLLVLSGTAYQVYAAFCVRDFFGRRRRSSPVKRPLPPVSVLKPMKGMEPGMQENVTSFLLQDYPQYEVLLGFSDPDDNAIRHLQEIAATGSKRVQVVVSTETVGANRKVSNLHGLAGSSHYPLLAVSDADMKADSLYLRDIVGEYLSGTNVGLVTCLYKISDPRTTGTALESLCIALDFLPSVLVARRLEGITFGLGASLLVPRDALESIGGFPALADYLADDYQLGNRLAKKGYTIVLSRVVLEDVAGPMSLGDFLVHQLRWARTYRASRPAGFAGYGMTYCLFFGALLIAVQPNALSFVLAGLALGSRLTLGSIVQRHVIKTRRWLRWLILLPAKDLISFLIWGWSFVGSRVTWRDRSYRIIQEGKIVEEGADGSGGIGSLPNVPLRRKPESGV